MGSYTGSMQYISAPLGRGRAKSLGGWALVREKEGEGCVFFLAFKHWLWHQLPQQVPWSNLHVSLLDLLSTPFSVCGLLKVRECAYLFFLLALKTRQTTKEIFGRGSTCECVSLFPLVCGSFLPLSVSSHVVPFGRRLFSLWQPFVLQKMERLSKYLAFQFAK